MANKLVIILKTTIKHNPNNLLIQQKNQLMIANNNLSYKVLALLYCVLLS